MNRSPNILLIFSDQQRADTLPSYGNSFVHAPNLERLASEGTTFTQCRSVFPVCTPARASMWTGVYPHTHTITGNVYGAADLLGERGWASKNMFSELQRAGYENAYFGKWHLGSDNPGCFNHFDAFNSLGGHWVDRKQAVQGGQWIPDRDTDRLIGWFRSRERTMPFSAVLSWYPPHDPYTAPLDCMEFYRQTRVPFPGYYASVTALDRCVGRILAALEESGQRENTLVMYYSDHGETFHQRDGKSNKFTCTEDSVHIPLIVRGPGVCDGQKVDALVGLQDIMPTVLDFAGVRIPEHIQGRSMRPLLRQSGEHTWRQGFYIENVTNAVLMDGEEEFSPRLAERALIHGRYKLIISEGDVPPKLFDLEGDPEERLDLLASRGQPTGGIVDDLLEMLTDIATELSDKEGLEILMAYEAASVTTSRTF